MILRSLKISSQSGHRWAGVFRRFSAKFAHIWKKSPNSIRSKVDVYEGFIAKHSLIGGRVTTRVVDMPGLLLGVTDPMTEGYFTSPLSQVYLWPFFDRDIFAPGVPFPDDLVPQPQDPGSYMIRFHRWLYGDASLGLGTPWAGEHWFTTVSCPTDCHGIGASMLASNLQTPASGQNYATVFNSASFVAKYLFFIAQRGTASRPPIDVMEIGFFENGLPPDMFLMPRMYPSSTSGGSGLALSVRMPRQIPLPTCARDRARCVGVTTYTGSPTRTAFEYACGDTGAALTFFSALNVNQLVLNKLEPSANILAAPVEVEAWSEDKPWIQEFETTEEVTWFNPVLDENETINVDVTHKVIYPVGGTYLKAEIPFQAHMPNHIGIPMVVMMNDRIEIYSDYRVTRTWVDERDDIYPGLTPLTMQTQTGIYQLTVPYVLDEEEQTASVGEMSNTLIVSDISGSAENGCFEALGGDREDYHRLYRVRWAGNVGGRSVVFASMIKHKRWETEPSGSIPDGGPVLPNLAAAQIRQTAQSGINRGHSVRWDWSYQRPDSTTVTGNRTWSLGNTVKIPGDDGDGLEWQDAVGVVMIVDGVITEWDAKTLGWCLLRSATAQSVREDDWRWEVTTQKWAASISDTEIALCAYSFPYVPGVTTCKLLKINVVSGAISLIREDSTTSSIVYPAITCYQRYKEKGDKVMEPCLIYRFGSQTEFGFIEISKDGGATWLRIWDNLATPAMGSFYIGSPIWTPEYGQVFQHYM